MKPEDMRSLTINAKLEELKNLDDWDYEERKIEGSNFNVLKNKTEKVEIIVREDSDNNLQTVNILTQDSLDIKPKPKDDQIMKLAKSLDEKEIGYSINVSENDIKELLKR
jgi:hypothetical protein